MAYNANKLTKLGALKQLAMKVSADYATREEVEALERTMEGIVAEGGQANVLEGVKVNGTALTITNKLVNLLIKVGGTDGTISVNGADIAVKGLAALIGNDSGKSARTIANEELAKQLIPEGAQESLNELREIAAWIQEHPEDAAAMNVAITALQNKVGTLPSDANSETIVAYITEAINEALSNRYTKTEVDAKLKGYYTATQIDGMIATDGEVSEMLNEVFGE